MSARRINHLKIYFFLVAVSFLTIFGVLFFVGYTLPLRKTPGAKLLSKSEKISQFRQFDLACDGKSFPIDKITVNQGDIVRIRLLAKGNNFDVVFPELNIKQEVKNNKNEIVEFQAVTPGQFNFICEKCKTGLLGQKTGGILVVYPTI